MDACTRHRVNYFAVNAQFVDSNKKLTIATMAIRDTKNQHSSDFIKTLVDDVLNEFDISKRQVLAVVTDNASNMTLAVKKLYEDPVAEECENDTDQEGLSALDDSMNLAFSFSAMSHMRCAAHTLQLAIRDGLKIDTVASLISQIRQVVTSARAPKIDAILKSKQGGHP